MVKSLPGQTTARNVGIHVDNDDFETFYFATPTWCAHVDEWTPGVNTGALKCTPPDMTSYHTIEALYTSNETNSYAQCVAVDGASAGCSSESFSFSSNYTEKDRTHFMSMSLVPQKVNGGIQSYPFNMWITHFEMWSCANVGVASAATCPGTIVTTLP
jgi:hypothetical protein